jgi:hypothetical protein
MPMRRTPAKASPLALRRPLTLELPSSCATLVEVDEAVVLIVRVAVAAEASVIPIVPPTEHVGFAVVLAPEGAVAKTQVRVMVPRYPLLGVAATVDVPLLPADARVTADAASV